MKAKPLILLVCLLIIETATCQIKRHTSLPFDWGYVTNISRYSKVGENKIDTSLSVQSVVSVALDSNRVDESVIQKLEQKNIDKLRLVAAMEGADAICVMKMECSDSTNYSNNGVWLGTRPYTTSVPYLETRLYKIGLIQPIQLPIKDVTGDSEYYRRKSIEETDRQIYSSNQQLRMAGKQNRFLTKIKVISHANAYKKDKLDTLELKTLINQSRYYSWVFTLHFNDLSEILTDTKPLQANFKIEKIRFEDNKIFVKTNHKQKRFRNRWLLVADFDVHHIRLSTQNGHQHYNIVGLRMNPL